MKRTLTHPVVFLLLVAGAMTSYWISSRPPPESPDARVRRLLYELGYQPSDGDFFWDGMPYDEADAEMKSLGREALPHLVDCLHDEDHRVRAQAVFRLRLMKDPATVPALIACVGDEDTEVCEQIIQALLEMAPEQAVEPIISMLRHPQWWPRRAAIAALRKLGDRRAIEPLRRFRDDPDRSAQARSEAAEAIIFLEGR